MRRGARKTCGAIHFLKHRYYKARHGSDNDRHALEWPGGQSNAEIWEPVPDDYEPDTEETIVEVEYISSEKPRKFRVIPEDRN